MSREFLITKFVCAVCGANLNITYDMPTKASNHAAGEPTGASVVNQRIAIEPCKPCAAPLQQIRSALEVLIKQGGAA
jgi:hypothetical protein